jgi:hypothetical protein
MPGITGNVNVNNFPSNVQITDGSISVTNFPTNVSITTMPAISAVFSGTANVNVVSTPSGVNAYTPHYFGNTVSAWTANVVSYPVLAITSNTGAAWQVWDYGLAVPTNVKNNVTPDVIRYVWIKNPTVTGNIVYNKTLGNIRVAEFFDTNKSIPWNSNITVNQSTGTVLHGDMFFGNNTESGQDMQYWQQSGSDIIVLCVQQLTTNVGTSTDIWWDLMVFEP